MPLIAAPPRLVRNAAHFPRPVVPLVETHRYQPCTLATGPAVPGVDQVSGEWGHAFLGLKTRVQEPEGCYLCGGWGELGQAVDVGF